MECLLCDNDFVLSFVLNRIMMRIYDNGDYDNEDDDEEEENDRIEEK